MIINNPNLYRELNVPFESKDKVTEAVNSFQDELYELRTKYRIPDLVYAMQLSWMDEGVESQAIVNGSMGNEMNAELLAAFALGKIQSQRQARIGKVLAQAYQNVKTP